MADRPVLPPRWCLDEAVWRAQQGLPVGSDPGERQVWLEAVWEWGRLHAWDEVDLLVVQRHYRRAPLLRRWVW